MAISDDLRAICLSEGSMCHFWPKNTKNTIFGKKSKVMCEMLDMVIWVLETENIHPKRLFDALSFLDFRQNEKKLGGNPYCFLVKNSHFWLNNSHFWLKNSKDFRLIFFHFPENPNMIGRQKVV